MNLFVIGDSTTGLNPPKPRHGGKVSWADEFSSYVNPAHASYRNRAIPGYSSRDYRHRGALAKILAETQPGDILLVCHGHIEGTPLTRDSRRPRGCLPGAGEETQTVEDPYFKRAETVHTFGWYLRACHALCQEKGVRPIFLSPPCRNVWESGLVRRTKSIGYADTMREVCASVGADFLDFGANTATLLNQAGPLFAARLYPRNDSTHTNVHGAKAFARVLAICLHKKLPHLILPPDAPVA